MNHHLKSLGFAIAASFVALVAGVAVHAPRPVLAVFGGVTIFLLIAVLIDVGAMPGGRARESDRLHKSAVFLLGGELLFMAGAALALLATGRMIGFLICSFATLSVGVAFSVVVLHRRRYVHAGVHAVEEYVREHE